MTKLTEEMIIARSKQSDLSQIKKLNCWGSELSDVSIIRRLKGVEVLALSVNKISNLADFEECPNLQELYLRKNNIQDINDLVYLQNLAKLKYLWLEENPCVDASGANYRRIVLRALPNLKKLDNVEVTPEEVRDAMRSPMTEQPAQSQQQIREEPIEEDYESNYRQQAANSGFRGHSPIREVRESQPLPPQSMQQSPEGTESECASDPIDRPPSISSPIQRTPLNHRHNDNYSPSENNHTPSPRYQNQRMQQSYERSPDDSPQISGNYRDPRGHMSTSMSTHSMKDYYQGQQPPAHYRHSQSDLTGGNGDWEENNQNGNHREYPQEKTRRGMITNGGSQDRYPDERRENFYQYRNGNMSREDFGEDLRRGRSENTVISNAVLSHLAGLHRRPVNRSSNLLSAVLCLVKELDYPSLEVVEHAVRCRLDELADSV
ncbi:unnamed protein product [Chironomus riparius]|uniref:U2A'/phosphoprotein 32 family A C-terminal domain-containing protein n=1 Tax=Chironomus riparius TaxID=315576 RepID=A0A9N9RNK5_9DIPT|nr:unnamed protein product [Chironomus riparius]